MLGRDLESILLGLALSWVRVHLKAVADDARLYTEGQELLHGGSGVGYALAS